MSKNKYKSCRKLAKRVIPIYTKLAAAALRDEAAKQRRRDKVGIRTATAQTLGTLEGMRTDPPVAEPTVAGRGPRVIILNAGTHQERHMLTTGRLVTFESTAAAGFQYNEPNPTARPGSDRDKRMVAKWKQEQEANRRYHEKRKQKQSQPMRAWSLPPKVDDGLMGQYQKQSRRTNQRRATA